MTDGWISLHRKSIESTIWTTKPATWYKIWQYILLKVAFTDTKTLKKGQGFFNFSQEYRAIGVDVTVNSIEHCIKFLKAAGQIAAKRAVRGTLITVLHYELYQNNHTPISGIESGSSSGSKAGRKREGSGSIYNNKDNKLNNNYKEELEILISHYNQTYNTHYKPNTGLLPNFKLWRESYSVEEMCTAIPKIRLHAYWSDKMTPEVLLRRQNTARQPVDYIGELVNLKVNPFK